SEPMPEKVSGDVPLSPPVKLAAVLLVTVAGKAMAGRLTGPLKTSALPGLLAAPRLLGLSVTLPGRVTALLRVRSVGSERTWPPARTSVPVPSGPVPPPLLLPTIRLPDARKVPPV